MAESHKERLDREVIELLNELRVALPGVQVLFAFLLLLPFQQSFAEVTVARAPDLLPGLRIDAAASVLLIAPSTYHRIRFRSVTRNRCCERPTGCCWEAPCCWGSRSRVSTFLVTDVVFGDPAGATAAAIAAAVVSWFWFGLPLSRKVRDQGDAGGQEPSDP